MIPKECKRLAEVDFPIAVVSKHAAKEKSIRYGHPSTMHLWWARRPLAACRAILLALLLPDPCHPLCPADFKAAALKTAGQRGWHGSGNSSASSIARQAASGRRAHHRCIVDGWPYRIDFSFA